MKNRITTKVVFIPNLRRGASRSTRKTGGDRAPPLHSQNVALTVTLSFRADEIGEESHTLQSCIYPLSP